ncbi:MAG: hypothetical protein WC454_08440, partial [Phycisphaerae bacterium]
SLRGLQSRDSYGAVNSAQFYPPYVWRTKSPPVYAGGLLFSLLSFPRKRESKFSEISNLKFFPTFPTFHTCSTVRPFSASAASGSTSKIKTATNILDFLSISAKLNR